MKNRTLLAVFFAALLGTLAWRWAPPAARASYTPPTAINTVGTVTAGTWQATKVAEAYGGTNQTTYTTGDLLYASASNTLSKLAAGTATYVLTSNGAGVAPSWQAASGGGGGVAVQDRDVTAQTVTNTTTETAVYSYSVPGNTLGSTKRLRLHANMHIASAGGQVTIRVKWGSASLTAVNAGFTTTGDSWRLDAEVTALNSTSSQDFNATCVTTTAFQGGPIRTTASEDSTAAKTLQITVEWSAADPANQFTCDTVVLELL